MTIDQKLELLERVLQVEPNTISPETSLEDLPQWDSLNIMNLQIELTVMQPDLQFEDLHMCNTVGEVCQKF
jgi:acyl carrier protein